MIRIRFYSSFATSELCKQRLEIMCGTSLIPEYGPDKKYYITTGDDYTHVIILNTAMPTLKPGIPRNRVIGFACEPPMFLNLNYTFIEYAMKNIGAYYIGDCTGLPYPFVEGNAYMWYNTPPLSIAPKRNIMSIMVSFKGVAPGHRYRHVLAKEILKQNLPVDIYGNGCDIYGLGRDSRIKGKFVLNEPYEGYMFHIAIENFETNEYFSEKIINPLFHETVPLYWGAKNIDKYFKNMYVHLNGSVDHDMDVIREVLRNPEHYRSIHVPNREHVENTMNLFKNKNVDIAFCE